MFDAIEMLQIITDSDSHAKTVTDVNGIMSAEKTTLKILPLSFTTEMRSTRLAIS
jgi:hypothetical protein